MQYAMRAQSKEIADVLRLPNAKWQAPAAVDAPAGLAEWLSARREETVRQLATCQAPVLPDAVVETLATIFLMQPGHRVMPFFVWLEDRLKR